MVGIGLLGLLLGGRGPSPLPSFTSTGGVEGGMGDGTREGGTGLRTFGPVSSPGTAVGPKNKYLQSRHLPKIKGNISLL